MLRRLPLVEESDVLQARAATKEGERLARGEFRDFVGERDARPDARGQEAGGDGAVRIGELDVLVATRVIEVGIDIPNATVGW